MLFIIGKAIDLHLLRSINGKNLFYCYVYDSIFRCKKFKHRSIERDEKKSRLDAWGYFCDYGQVSGQFEIFFLIHDFSINIENLKIHGLDCIRNQEQ